MKKFHFDIALVALSLSSSAWCNGLMTDITNGSSVSIDDHPDFVEIGYDAGDYGGYTNVGEICGGTMLDSTHVLTAAHCIFDSDTGELNIPYVLYYVVGQTDDASQFPSNVTTQKVSGVAFYSSFSDSSSDLWANDIAILTLENNLSVNGNVQYLSDETYRDVTNDFLAIGVGMTSSSTDNYDLLGTDLTYVTQAHCRSSESDLAGISDSQLCFTGSSTDTTGLLSGVCSGDSGGPVYWHVNGSYYQVGITSFGPSECGEGLGTYNITGVFTEVSDYSDWIENVLDDNPDSNTTTCTITDTEREAYMDGDSVTLCGVTATQSQSSGESMTSSSPSLDGEGSSSLSTDSSSGGGALSLSWLTVLMGVLGWRRYQQRRAD